MNAAHTTGKIIVAAMIVNAAALAAHQCSAVECKPNAAGLCMLPKVMLPKVEEADDLAESGGSLLAEAKKAAVAAGQAMQCDILQKEHVELNWKAKLAEEFSDLQNQFILKMREAGLLLQLPRMAVEFMERCGLNNNAGWTQQEPCIPYKKAISTCSEES